ncbi:MAG: hypothetical protein R2850_00305 [Bacteroidia bacterium]
MRVSLLSFILLVFVSCSKEKSEYITDNDAPPYSEVSSVKLRNYVNRVFIDLIGREPLDEEMDLETYQLRQNHASVQSRLDLVNRLMFDDSYRPGDSSYTYAYFRRVYDLGKIRFLEGVSDEGLQGEANIFRNNAISDSLGGDQAGYDENMAQYNYLIDVLGSAQAFMDGTISISEQNGYMLLNSVYDIINMNSFNFVNATFNDLLFRFPTQNEFNIAYDIVENNTPGALFGAQASNKSQYVSLISSCSEAAEGTIIWCYTTLLSREPSSTELNRELQKFGLDHNFHELQQRILISDEYANF